MPVGIASPFWVKTTPPRLTNVWVIGPKNEIDTVRNAPKVPTATLELPAEFQVGEKGTARLHYNLPPHVQLQRSEQPAPLEQIDYEIVKPNDNP